MRRPAVGAALAVMAAVGACMDEEPRFGPAGSIYDRRLPSERNADGGGGRAAASSSSGGGSTPTGSALFDAPFDPASPPPAGAPLASRHPAPIDGAAECLGCHIAGGAASTKPWLFGGHIDQTNLAAGTICEVVVVTSAGEKILVKATADGYFWAPGRTLAGSLVNARTAVRAQTGEGGEMKTMAHGACNSTGTCHAGSTGPITVAR